jgi:hypothetical protein
MVVQYGFVTLFMMVRPLATFFALLNTVVEIRIGAYKLPVSNKQSLPLKSCGIGSWKGVLQEITYFLQQPAVLS